MSFLKTIAQVIVTRAGYPVPADPPKSKSSGKSGMFAGIINNMQQSQQQAGSLQIPTPPTPPADPNDVEAQRRYNQQLLTYNQQFQNYNARVMAVFMQRFNVMQQAMIQAQQNQAAQSQTASNISSPIGDTASIGSIF